MLKEILKKTIYKKLIVIKTTEQTIKIFMNKNPNNKPKKIQLMKITLMKTKQNPRMNKLIKIN
jgi:hypothetical protein